MANLILTTSVTIFAGLAECLRPQPDGKIVGGVPVDIQYFPYQVSLQYNGQHYCGGSIVSAKHVVTAAHCSPNWDVITNFTVRAGTSYQGSGGVVVPMSTYLKHPSFNSTTMDYDVCVITLASTLSLNDYIQPIGLATTIPPDNNYVIITGWGYTKEGGQTAYQLQATAVQMINKYLCSLRYGASLTDRMICAGNWASGARDACQGDSGGPLAFQGKLVGVVSWGVGCARAYYPGIYTSIPYVRQFIESAMV